MISAFGIEHSDISKGLPKGIVRGMLASGKGSTYSLRRIQTHAIGRTHRPADDMTRRMGMSYKDAEKSALKHSRSKGRIGTDKPKAWG